MNIHGGFNFPHLSETDDRQPLFTFSVPSSISSSMVDGTTTTTITTKTNTEYGFLMLSFAYWTELLALLFIALSIAAVVGLFLYRTVIKPKQEGTMQAYVVGWGLVLPFWALWPFLIMGVIDIRNAMFKFVIGGIVPIVCFFRTTECIYGFAPDHVTRSASEFCFYYATVPIVARVKRDRRQQQQQGSNKITKQERDGEIKISKNIGNIGDPIPCTLSKTMKHFARFIALLFITGSLQSILNPHHYFAVFGMGDEELSWYAIERYFTWQLYANSALQALLFQMYLTTYCEALIFAFTVVTGYEAEPVMDNPLLESESPSDFWGRRWNLLIHTVLKNGVYKPVRKFTFSRTVAVLTTFLTSGIFHEWILFMIFGGGKNNNNYQPNYGSATVFFLWQALMIGLELTLGGSKLVQKISNTLPRPLKTAFVVGMGVPLAHFFLEPYIRSESFFVHGGLGLPMIVPI